MCPANQANGLDGSVLLVLPQTKSRQRLQNVPETVTITVPLVLAYVWAVIPRLQPSERLFHASAQAFRREYQSLVQLARLPACRWHPYSVRRGGATTHHIEFGNLDRTMMRGEWASIKTKRLYVNSTVASVAEISATPTQQRSIDRMAGKASQNILGGAKL